MEDLLIFAVEDVTVEELSEYSGAATYGTAGTASTVSTPVGSAACIGTASSY